MQITTDIIWRLRERDSKYTAECERFGQNLSPIGAGFGVLPQIVIDVVGRLILIRRYYERKSNIYIKLNLL